MSDIHVMTDTAHEPSRAVVVAVVLALPVAATLLMELAEALINSIGWKLRIARTGWDLCVLALGSTGGVFTLPGVVRRWGEDWTVILGLIAFVGELGCGLFIIHLRKTPPEKVKGWQRVKCVEVCKSLLGGLGD